MGTKQERQAGGRSGVNLIQHIRWALEHDDLEALAMLYAENATLEEISNLSPPKHPLVVHGREAILNHMREEMHRDPVSGWARQVQSSELIDPVETDDRIAFTEVRTYEAGDKMVAQHVAHKENGRISHDRLVVAWDPA